MWSDNVIQLSYSPPTSTASGILIYTDNKDNGSGDPLHSVSLRGGVVGGFGSVDPNDNQRESVIPLIWKWEDISTLRAASGAKTNGTVKIPAGNQLFMPTEITDPLG